MKINTFVLLVISVFLLFSGLKMSAQSGKPDFSAIDAKAKRSPKALAKDLPGLTAYLAEGYETELEQVRAIYVWITTHIDYDWKAVEQDKRINHFIADILERKLALCVGYAQLFQKMCELTGITSVMVNGYAKSTVATQLPLEEPNHSWNAVRIDGRWHLLDATWGSSTISKENDFVSISNDDYFLVPPEKFVLTHLPGNPMWQLLTNPVPTDVFMQSDSVVVQYLNLSDSTFAFLDSLAGFFHLSPEQQRLHEYDLTYRSHPTPANAGQLGHALIDYAGILADSLEILIDESNREKFLQLNYEVILNCRRAATFISFYAWQQELFINALINRAVFQFNWQEDAGPEIIALLEEARELLSTSEDSYFIKMARQQCEHYLDIVSSR